jgi:hypothetical protein
MKQFLVWVVMQYFVLGLVFSCFYALLSRRVTPRSVLLEFLAVAASLVDRGEGDLSEHGQG